MLDARAVRRQVITCRRCGLRAGCRRPVPFRGPAPSQVALVGEAPGATEDSYGKPFIGAAGQLLDELAAEADLDPGDWFICNIVSCRPPSNRDPSPQEIAACRPNLLAQLAVANPRIIIPVGRFALEHFLPTTAAPAKITEIHGRPFSVSGTHYFPLIHPAAALRSEETKRLVAIDLLILKRFIDDPFSVWPETCESCGKPVDRYDETGRAWCRTHYPPRRYTQISLDGMPARVVKPRKKRASSRVRAQSQ